MRQDFKFNFELNDIDIVNGDFVLTEDASRQNAALLLMKDATNILYPQWGTYLERWSINVSSSYLYALAAEAQRQVLDDGATVCKISVYPRSGISGWEVDVSAKYPE